MQSKSAILIRSYAFLDVVKKIWIFILLILPMLSGCIVTDFYEKVMEKIQHPPEYEWQKVIEDEERFGWVDMINFEMAMVNDYTIFLENGTRYLQIFIEVEFSNPIKPELESLNQGRLNLTIIPPSGENTTKSYCTTGKSHSYDDYFYFFSPEKGTWKIIVKVTGCGKYKILAQAYQPS